MSVHPFKTKTKSVDLECSSCGAPGKGTCDCNAGYAQVKERAAVAVASGAGKSDRVLAKESGVSRGSIQRARSGGSIEPPVQRTGQDGKSYPAKPVKTVTEFYAAQAKSVGEKPQTVWRRGLIARAKMAAGDALYEDWSEFKVDRQLIDAVNEAVISWQKLAAYLENLHDKT